MEQRHAYEANEPVSDEELRALIERFGERQAGQSTQPTVRDVAETLQVDTQTVGAMLAELRKSKSEAEVKERLDRLERENEELRARTDNEYGFGRPFRRRRRRAAMMAAMLAIMVGALFSVRGGGLGGAEWMFIALIAMAAVFIIRLRHGGGR